MGSAVGSRDYYEVLGVPRDADAQAVKNAFRQLARRYHPDTSTEPDAEQRFKEIAEAYGVLSDPAKRASYDAQGSAGLAGATAEDLWGGIDLADIFGPGAAAFGSLFERLFEQPSAGLWRGEDVHLDLAVSMGEVLAGGKQAVRIRRPAPCRRCGGRRRVTDRPCPACAASGRTLREETVTIRIPPGIPDGATLRLAGRGMPSPMPGGTPGDAYVNIRTRADPRFTRVGADLWHDLHIQAPDAALGITAAVPLLDGQVRVRVPPGTQPGSVLRVEGRGLPRYGGHGRGSLNLTVILDIPRQLSSRQRQLYEQLRAEDAGISSTVSRPGAPGAPRSLGRMTAGPRGWHARGRRLIIALVLLLAIGAVNLVGGIAAVAGSRAFLTNVHYVAGGPWAWGWVMAILGAVQLLAAAGVWAGSQPARWLAVAAAGLNVIGLMFLLPAYPFWSLLITAADAMVLCGLSAYGAPENLDSRWHGSPPGGCQ
jgi:molecular chaperone DnaJ